MITLDVTDLVLIAARTLGIGTDAALSQLDATAAQAALAEACPASNAMTDRGTAAAATIGLMQALLRHPPFAPHAEPVAVVAALQFLSLNGWRADLEPPATAAVVVEALACGRLSPASAAAWLSPRLAIDAGQAAKVPPSVRYPEALLLVQAGCWALGAVAGLIVLAAITRSGAPWPVTFLPLSWVALTGGLATAKVRLSARLGRGRSQRAWRAVIATELAMTCFGLLWLPIGGYPFIMAGLPGAALSLAAVWCLTRPRARQYCGRPDAVPGPRVQARDRDAGCWQHAPGTGRLAMV